MATKKTLPSPDPTTHSALLALDPSFGAPPDMPVAVAVREYASLARLARASHGPLGKIGIALARIDHLAALARRLDADEKAWKKARGKVPLAPAGKKLLAEAEALDATLLAGGRWACRKDKVAQEELSRIAEGSGLADTIQDLRDLVVFWTDPEHAGRLSKTDITTKDLARATELAGLLDEAAATEAADVLAAAALDLRNRAFWAGDELAKEIREGGRYAFRKDPKVAAKFTSRYRAAVNRRYHKRRAKPATPPIALAS